LFVAITPSAMALDELDAALAPLRAARPDLRWSSRESWHITLAFLGEVDAKTAARLAARMERAAGRHPGLDLQIAGGGAFPNVPRARVLWAGIQGDQKALQDIADSVVAGAKRAGAPPPDERQLRAHVTVARCRESTDVRDLVDALAAFSGSTWPAGRIHLIRSHLGPRPRYESIGSWPLGAPRPRGVGCQT
jgi:RNA 2',3'-cyclic 3'-phosphodiesterase